MRRAPLQSACPAPPTLQLPAGSLSEARSMELLAKAAPALAAQPGIKLGNLRYQGNTLDAQLSASEGTALENLLNALRQQSGMQAELAEQRVEGREAQARLRLKGAQG